MPDQVLTIEANDIQKFYFRVEGGTLSIGFDPNHSEGMVRNLRIKGIRCELEVGDGPVTVRTADANGKKAEHALALDEERRLGSARLRVMPTLGEIDEIEEPADSPGHRLVVVNGADFGRVFPVNGSGMTRIGKDAKAADVTLNDLYVAHVHCQLEDVAGRVFVSHLNGSGGTYVNGQKIGGRTELKVGDVVRVGNSHLKLELDVSQPHAETAAPSAAPPAEPEEVVDSWSGEEPAFRSKRHAAAAAAVAPPPRPAPPPPKPVRDTRTLDKLLQLENQTFGHFQVGDRLGHGHVGVVFRARDLKTNQTVALKVLSPEFPKSEVELQNLGRVVKAAPSLRDSHLVSLNGVGRSGAYTWISREYVDGDSLGNLLARYAKEGKVSWKRACRIGAQIGAALDFLHQHKIAHLNVTPRNVLIRREDSCAKLADVLLAQALHGSHLHKETHEHKRLAEAAYLAPEQLSGSVTPDIRVDQYALGVMCYELACGQPPFVGNSLEELQEAIQTGEISKPSRLHKDIPPPLDAAMVKLLARDPAQRFHEIGEFLDIVEPILMMHDIR